MAAMGASETVPAWVGENTQSRGVCRRNSSGDSWGGCLGEKRSGYGGHILGTDRTPVWGGPVRLQVFKWNRSLLQRMRVV